MLKCVNVALTPASLPPDRERDERRPHAASTQVEEELEVSKQMADDDFYKLLQVDPDAEPEVIEAAFRRLARKYHPDVNPAPEAPAHMQRLTGAYEVLRDSQLRAAYDRERGAARPLPPRSSKVDEEPGLGVSLLGGLVGLDLRLRKRKR